MASQNGVINASEGELEAAASSCETWAKWCGAAVVLGLIIEVALAVKHPPFDSFVGIWGSVIADSLVALGVFGELLFSAMGSKRHGELQRRSKLMVAELNMQAREATVRAAEANRIAEGERLARVKLETGLASRRLTAEQSSKLTSALYAVKAQIPELQLSRLGNREALDFANDILKSVEDSGISVEVADIETLEFLKPHGLRLSDTPGGLLRTAFESAGITINDSANTNARPIIFVGLKPPPF